MEIPLPPELPAGAFALGDAEDAALALYQRLSDLTRNAGEAERRMQEALREQAENHRRTIASLAAQRFEFRRLALRLGPELSRAGLTEMLRAVDLFERAWDQTLRRNRLEVSDLAGCPLTDELAAEIEVEGHVPDENARTAAVRETLSPLVRLDGKTLAMAKVITTVPVRKEELPQ